MNERAIVDFKHEAIEIGVEHIISLSKIQVIKNDYRVISRTRIDLVRAFESLLEKYREVIVLRDLQEKTMDEIAAEVGVGVGVGGEVCASHTISFQNTVCNP